jgi:ABC-type proline/glycine betaine transport system permease subunit
MVIVMRLTLSELIMARCWEFGASVLSLIPFIVVHSVMSGDSVVRALLEAPAIAVTLVSAFFGLFLYVFAACVFHYAAFRLLKSWTVAAMAPAILAAGLGSWIISGWSNPIANIGVVWGAMAAMTVAIFSSGFFWARWRLRSFGGKDEVGVGDLKAG